LFPSEIIGEVINAAIAPEVESTFSEASYQVFQSVDYGQAKDLFWCVSLDCSYFGNGICPMAAGFEFCQWMQLTRVQGLALMLSAQSTEAEIVKGLRSGADDC
jgi:DNA-binding response OmpR family regulator